MDQLQCLGILQTCEVLKVGMPTRVTYTELKEVSCDTSEQTRAPADFFGFDMPSHSISKRRFVFWRDRKTVPCVS